MRALWRNLLLLAFALLWTNGVSAQEHATDAPLFEGAYKQLRSLMDKDDREGLRTLAKEYWTHADSSVRQLAALAEAVADYRIGRFPECAKRLDSLSKDTHVADRRLRSVMRRFEAGLLDRSGDRHGGLDILEMGLVEADSIDTFNERIDLLVMRGELLLDDDQDDLALASLMEAQRLAERHGIERGLCMVRVNMGNLRFGQYRWEDALDDYKKALVLARRNGLDGLAVTCVANMGAAAASSGRYALALQLMDSLYQTTDPADVPLRASLLGQVGYLRA